MTINSNPAGLLPMPVMLASVTACSYVPGLGLTTSYPTTLCTVRRGPVRGLWGLQARSNRPRASEGLTRCFFQRFPEEQVHMLDVWGR